MAPYEFIIFKLDLDVLNGPAKRRVRLPKWSRRRAAGPCNPKKSYLLSTYLLDVLVDGLHLGLAALLRGGHLEALIGDLGLGADLDFVGLKLNFAHLFVRHKARVSHEAKSMGGGAAPARPQSRSNLPSGR